MMRNGRDRRLGKPVMGHAIVERVLLFGTRSADHIRASGHSGCIAMEVTSPFENRPDTWLHPNVSQKARFLLHRGRRPYMTHRKLLQSKAIAIENDLRGTLRNFGLKVGMVGTVKFEGRIKELVENLPDLAILVEPLLIVRRALREQIVILHRRLLAIVRDDAVCRRLMTTPGVGPVVALTYRATVDVPARFRKSKSVGAVFGLTCSKYQSGEIDRSGRISRCGDEMMRVMLYEAAQAMLLRSTRWSWLKAWAMQIARRRGMKKAVVALARRLAVIMHRIWVDGTEFRWTREAAAA